MFAPLSAAPRVVVVVATPQSQPCSAGTRVGYVPTSYMAQRKFKVVASLGGALTMLVGSGGVDSEQRLVASSAPPRTDLATQQRPRGGEIVQPATFKQQWTMHAGPGCHCRRFVPKPAQRHSVIVTSPLHGKLLR